MSETVVVVENIVPQVSVTFSNDQGPQGATGPAGPKGDTGPAGPTGPANGTATPSALGVAAAGTSTLSAHEDHVHPTTGVVTTASLATGMNTFLGSPSSANLLSTMTDDTGTGLLVFNNSPTLAGTPLSTTAAVDTNTTQIATTAYVLGQASATTPSMDGTATVGTSTRYSRADHIHPTDTSRAPLASPALTGVPTSPTAAVDTNTTQIATTAYVVGQGYAKLASPALTGTPTSTTAAVDTNTTQIATTAYVVGQGYAKLASPTFTGTPTLPTGTIATTQTAGNSTTAVATTAFVTTADNLKANIASPTFTGTVTIPISSITSYQKYAVGALTTPITANTYTVLDTDTYIIFNRNSAITVTLPTASSYTGRMLHIKTINTGAVSSATSNVVPLAGGAAATTLFSAAAAGKFTILVSDGTNWVIMAQN